MSHETPIKQRLHITFGKFDALKYIGHLDLAKTWERVLRRADLPVLYTQGFNMRPRFQLASALALGITSECEVIDVSLRERLSAVDGVQERLVAVSPAGLHIYQVEDVDVYGPPLQTLVLSAEYRISMFDEVDLAVLREKVRAMLQSEHIIKVKTRKRRKSTTDIRPMIHALEVDANGDIIAHLAAGERGSLRPADVMAELGLEDSHFNVHRFRLHMDSYHDRRHNYRTNTQ